MIGTSLIHHFFSVGDVPIGCAGSFAYALPPKCQPPCVVDQNSRGV
jgi:hypothetical protein